MAFTVTCSDSFNVSEANIVCDLCLNLNAQKSDDTVKDTVLWMRNESDVQALIWKKNLGVS